MTRRTRRTPCATIPPAPAMTTPPTGWNASPCAGWRNIAGCDWRRRNHAAIALGAFALGFALSSVLGVRCLRAGRAERNAWQRNYQMECRRHDIALRRMESREALAAANIVQLASALQDATAQAQAHGAHGGPQVGGDLLGRFSWN